MNNLKQLYGENKVLLRTTFILIAVLVIYLIITLISMWQSHVNEKNTYRVEVNEYVGDGIKAFDVTGLSNEQISEYLDNYRSQEESDGNN